MSDTYLWSKLINLAYQRNFLLARNLEGFRAEGTNILKSKNNKYVLRPTYGEESGWQDEDDYKEYADKFLKPHKDLLVELLGKLGGGD